jgi:hypothetical protein
MYEWASMFTNDGRFLARCYKPHSYEYEVCPKPNQYYEMTGIRHNDDNHCEEEEKNHQTHIALQFEPKELFSLWSQYKQFTLYVGYVNEIMDSSSSDYFLHVDIVELV